MKTLSKRAEIIQSAALLFRKKGYTATSVRDIAREMGMEASSLYNHVSSKQEILKELLISVAHLFSEGMREIKPAPLTAYQKLERLVALHVRITIEQTDAVSLIPKEWIHLETEHIKEFLTLRDTYEKDFKSIIIKGMEEESIREINPEVATFSILSTLRWLYSWITKNAEINSITLEEEMKKCLLEGLQR